MYVRRPSPIWARTIWLFCAVLACACQSPPVSPRVPAAPRAAAVVAPAATHDAPVAASLPNAVPPPSWRFLPGSTPAAVRAAHYLVDSDSALASRVGADVLAAGGNASDATVAVAFALAVVYPEAGNLGGGGFAVVRAADGTRAALDFRETAPQRAQRDMFFAKKPKSRAGVNAPASAGPSDASRVGLLASGVPGSVAGLWALHQRFGSRPWAELLAPAIALAEHGFAVDAETARSLSDAHAKLKRFPASKALFFPGGKALSAGELSHNPELAKVLRRIAAQGRDGFYKGETARLITNEMARGAGLITLSDLAGYEAKWRAPIEFEYRGQTVVSMPPPSSGGVALALIANILKGYPIRDLGWHSTEHLHLLAEAMRRAFADRNELLGDPDFVKVPLGQLLSAEYGAERRATISERATPSSSVRPGLPTPEGTQTTHFSVVDEHGAAVALTTSINDFFGSGVTVSGAGFLLNDEMDDFATQPGAPNLYGLVQGAANAIAPGKRMLSSMAPTLVLDADGAVRVVAGARGGPRIISATWQVISNIVDFGFSSEQAVDAPRIHQQWQPDEVACEKDGFSPEQLGALEALGYKIHLVDDIANSPAIAREAIGGAWLGAFDPRRGGAAIGN
jgi:gamma-glutamyltranspeptidase/glutathione hydrolase